MRYMFQSHLSRLVVAVLFLAGPAASHGHAAVLMSARTGAAPFPAAQGAAAPSQSWRLYPRGLFRRQFSGISLLPSIQEVPFALPALKRALDRTALTPEAAGRMAPEEQAEAIRSAIRASAERVLEEEVASAPTTANLTEAIRKAVDLRAKIRDLRLVQLLLPEKKREAFLEGFGRTEATLSGRIQEMSTQLVRPRIKDIFSSGEAEWMGRTAVIQLENGAALAFKKMHNPKDFERELASMEQVRQWGVEAPIPLLQEDGEIGGRFPGETSTEFHFVPYLIPTGLAKDFKAYLDDALPAGLSRREKFEKIEAATFRAVDHMLLLLDNGHAHETLMPLSHSDDHWEWDYWRWVMPVLGGMRWGPTFISEWRKAFQYPNLRLSGLADYEHVQPLKHFIREHDNYDHGRVRHDIYSSALGQNLSELGLVLLHSGAVNRLSNAETARIIWEGLRRYSEGLLPTEALGSLNEERFLRALRSASRRFRLVQALRIVTMPGWAVQPLILNGVKPVVEALRAHEAAGKPVHPHPVLSRRPTLVSSLFVGITIPVYIIAGGTIVLLAVTDLLGAPQWEEALPVSLLLGFILMPLRIMLKPLSPAVRWFIDQADTLYWTTKARLGVR